MEQMPFDDEFVVLAGIVVQAVESWLLVAADAFRTAGEHSYLDLRPIARP
jgi:hypothetical protein